MRKTFQVVVLAALTLTLGCLCCCIPGLEDTTTTSLMETTTTLACIPPQMAYGNGCCLDENLNNVCDREEPATTTETQVTTTTSLQETTTTSMQETMTTSSTTTTTLSCSDGIKNQDEVMVDCGGKCKNECNVFNLTADKEAVNFQSYGFSLQDSILETDGIKYTIQITTPDGYTDTREMNVGGQSWIDHVKFKIEASIGSGIMVSARIDAELVNKTPSGATVKTIGGKSCVQQGGGICTRSYNNYRITMIHRIDGGGVRFKITHPNGLETEGTAYQNGSRYMTVGTGGVIVGVLDYMMSGGYSNIYVKSK